MWGRWISFWIRNISIQDFWVLEKVFSASKHICTRLLGVINALSGLKHISICTSLWGVEKMFSDSNCFSSFCGSAESVTAFKSYQYLFKFVGVEKVFSGSNHISKCTSLWRWRRCFRIWIISVVLQVLGLEKVFLDSNYISSCTRFVWVLNVLSGLHHISSYSSLWEWKRCFWIRIISVVVQVCEGGEGVFGFNPSQHCFVRVVNVVRVRTILVVVHIFGYKDVVFGSQPYNF